MLTRIRIRGFKAVFDATLTLGDFTLLIGRNGAGKSTAVEALQWLRDATFRGLSAATGPYDHFDELVNRRAESVELDVRFQRTPKAQPVHYVVRVVRSFVPTGGTARPLVGYERCVVGRTSAAKAVISSRKGIRGPVYRWVGGRRELLVRTGDELGLTYAPTVHATGAMDLHAFLGRAVFLRLSPIAIASSSARERGGGWSPLLADDGHDLPLLLERLSDKARARVAQRVRSIFEDVRGVKVVKVGEDRHFVVREYMRSQGGNKTYDIPAWMLSEGMRRIVAIFALLETDPKPSLIAIEEVENGLDPWTLQRVLEALRDASSSIQMLLTTHSPFLLDHVDAHDVVHVRRERGDTTYEPILTIGQATRYQGVLAPGAMYLSNVFGDETPPSSQDDAKADDGEDS